MGDGLKLPTPDLRLPASTPRVARSNMLPDRQYVMLAGSMFKDGLDRLLVPQGTDPDNIMALENALVDLDEQRDRLRAVEQNVRRVLKLLGGTEAGTWPAPA